MNLFIILLIAVSLSMDAFSLSLALGTLNINQKDKYLLSLITGIFHFIMPLIGKSIGLIILSFIKNTNMVVTIILSFIGVEMIIASFKKEEIKLMSYPEYFLFAFAVSLDSLSIGITLTNTNNYVPPLLFALTSAFFTYLGLSIGTKIENKIGKVSTIIGGTTLIIIGISYLI